MSEGLNKDFSKRVVLHSAALDWQASPSPTVWRKRLDLAGAKEASRVTSVVRYDAGSAFHSHPHPDGEEILVLEGVFSDEHGDYPTGSFLLNPEGFEHAPFSHDGCVLFVKLQQYPGSARRQIALDSGAATWRPGPAEGISSAALYGEAGYPETMELLRFNPGAGIEGLSHPGGAEIFLLEGALEDEEGAYQAGSWLRLPPGSRHSPCSAGGCRLYLKRGHLLFGA